MATYLYCVLSEPRGVPDALTGVEGAPVRSIRAGELGAWASDVAEAPVSPTVERLRAHDVVCAAALDTGETPLPVRFGQTFPDDEAMISAIASQRTLLRQRLARVAGCIELRVVATRPLAAPADDHTVVQEERSHEGAGGPGTAFLRERARRLREERIPDGWCEQVRRVIGNVAGPLIVDYQACEIRRGLAYLPLLVRRTDAERCRARIVRGLAGAGQPISVLGPFAPYSFSSGG
jgi:hypothetical protein